MEVSLLPLFTLTLVFTREVEILRFIPMEVGSSSRADEALRVGGFVEAFDDCGIYVCAYRWMDGWMKMSSLECQVNRM
jgi:hypothetical protein